MLLTITTTTAPATDLGYLLVKNPARSQTFNLAFGAAHVFYPEASDERCTAALLLEVDPVTLVRGRAGSPAEGMLDQYVNDRPYVASSFLSVAIAQVFNSALGGRSKDRPDRVNEPIDLQATIAVLPCGGGEALIRRLFEPLGYHVQVESYLRDEQFPEWGVSPYYTVTIAARKPLKDLLAHLYVLVPVLDDEKHYYFGPDEIEKLLRRGDGWLQAHPDRDLITARYLRRKPFIRAALARLVEADQPDPDAAETAHAQEEAVVEERISLHTQRLNAVVAVLKQSGAQRVLDLGCGEGRLIQLLLGEPAFREIVGIDVSHRVLERAHDKLRLDRLPPTRRDRIKLLQGSLTYRDSRIAGFDAAAVVEVIEHLDPYRLHAFERVLWEFARPRTIVLTTPNVEYNVRWESLPAGKFRHRDHRFEWNRAEFETWAQNVADRFGYGVRFLPVGPNDPDVGPPSQMAVFSLQSA